MMADTDDLTISLSDRFPQEDEGPNEDTAKYISFSTDGYLPTNESPPHRASTICHGDLNGLQPYTPTFPLYDIPSTTANDMLPTSDGSISIYDPSSEAHVCVVQTEPVDIAFLTSTLHDTTYVPYLIRPSDRTSDHLQFIPSYATSGIPFFEEKILDSKATAGMVPFWTSSIVSSVPADIPDNEFGGLSFQKSRKKRAYIKAFL